MGLLWEHMEDLKKMIGFFDDFKPRMLKAVRRLRSELEALKGSVGEWILFLDRNQIEMQQKVSALEKRVEELERKDSKRVKVQTF